MGTTGHDYYLSYRYGIEIKTRVATNSYPLEMTFLRDAYRALHTRNGASVTLQRCIDIYERGDTMLGVTGRIDTFLARLSFFDERISSDKQKRLINSVVCMKLELPLSTFPDAVLLNLAISYIPQSYSFTAEARLDGPPDYIHPVTPAALQAAMALYAPRAALSVQEAAVHEYVFQSASMPRFVKGRMLEFYILQPLSVAPPFKLAGFQLGKKTNVASTALTTLADVCAVQQQVVRWNGNALPPGEIDVAINVLFWTNSANYPGVDGMLWLADAKTLVLLQITISSVHGNKSNFWVGDDSRTSLWRNRLGARQIKELWLTPYTSAGKKPAHAGQFVCTLAQLLEQNTGMFPLLRKWEPSEEAMNEPPPQSDVSSS